MFIEQFKFITSLSNIRNVKNISTFSTTYVLHKDKIIKIKYIIHKNMRICNSLIKTSNVLINTNTAGLNVWIMINGF